MSDCTNRSHARKTARLHAEVAAWKMLASSPQEVLDRVIALERERDEALAQVAVLLHHELICAKEHGPSATKGELSTFVADQAHALLDRLQRAEAVVEAAKPIWNRMASFGGVAKMPTTVVFTWDEAIKFKEALAAWEEGTG